MTCEHEDLDISLDEASGDPVRIICEQCHSVWPVTKIRPVKVGLELLRPEPVKDELAAVVAERDRLRAVVEAARNLILNDSGHWSQHYVPLVVALDALDVSGNTGSEHDRVVDRNAAQAEHDISGNTVTPEELGNPEWNRYE